MNRYIVLALCAVTALQGWSMGRQYERESGERYVSQTSDHRAFVSELHRIVGTRYDDFDRPDMDRH